MTTAVTPSKAVGVYGFGVARCSTLQSTGGPRSSRGFAPQDDKGSGIVLHRMPVLINGHILELQFMQRVIQTFHG